MDPVSAIAAVLGVTSLIVWRVDPRFRRPPRSMVGLLEHAARLASERGQRPVTLSHLVLALLSNPEVGSFLDQHGIDDTDLLRELEKLLPPEIEGPSPDVTVSDFDGSLLRFIAPSRATAIDAGEHDGSRPMERREDTI